MLQMHVIILSTSLLRLPVPPVAQSATPSNSTSFAITGNFAGRFDIGGDRHMCRTCRGDGSDTGILPSRDPRRNERYPHGLAIVPPPLYANDAVRRRGCQPISFPRRARQSTQTVVNEAMIAPDQVEAPLPKLDVLLEDTMSRTGVPGASVAVVYDDVVVYERAIEIMIGPSRKATWASLGLPTVGPDANALFTRMESGG